MWPSVWRQLEASAGAFAEDDCIHMYTFALSISPEHLAALKGFHFMS